jgi:glyoxylase-like metal-dependent hydrolase (beta-lactamase superfamily II)
MSKNSTALPMSRRDLLKVFGLGSAGFAIGSRFGDLPRAYAQDIVVAPRASAFYTLPVGDIEITVIQEGSIVIDPSMFGSNVDSGAASAVLAASNLPSDVIASTINISLIRTGNHLALVDTGLGDFPFPGSSTNRLVPTLKVLGVNPEDITDVVLTHFHPDHIGGASSNDGMLTFPNAIYHMGDIEYDFLINTSGTPVDDLINAAKARIQPAVDIDQFNVFAVESEILPGVYAAHTPGHTPGHVSLRISSGSEQVFATLDVANHALIALANPDWHFAFDAMPDVAVETRKSVFGMLADEKTKVLGYHFPFPGVGYIDRDGEGFRYIGA